MANEFYEATTHWAVIIGINYYPEHYDGCLKGCVRDAEATRLYLEEAIEINADIVVLAASTPSVHGLPPPEKPEVWPTYVNVIAQLKRIIDKAECGDRVYIHYSGHGTKLLSRDKRPELALVLLDEGGCKSRSLRSVYLAKALREMVEKKLYVTLVLDCCFSGGVARSSDYCGFDVRFIEHDFDYDSVYIHELDTKFSDASSTLRDASVEDDWLINPKGYTILSACAPDQIAIEIETNGKRKGALTHFLLDALHNLRVNGVKLTHHSLHEHLSTSFHAHWPQQTPMRYGNANLSLFGDSLLAPENDFVPIYKEDGRLCLRAGDIHGVHKGDEYVAYPFSTPEQANGQVEEGNANVRVTSVRLFESDLMQIDPTTIMVQIQTGWKAKLLTSLSPRIVCVGLLASFTRSIQPEFSVEGLRYMRLITRQEAEKHQTEESCMYNVAINENNEYEVVNTLLEKVSAIPAIPCNSDSATKALVNVLQHIAKFKYFEGVENRVPCKAFQASFSLVSECPAGNSNRIDIKHGDRWRFTVKNKCKKQLYLGIFNFRPSWEVKSLTTASGGGGYLIIPAKVGEIDGERQLSINMQVPQFLLKDGITECEDLMKIFITSKPTSFHVALPDISQTARGQHGILRGSDDLSDFLSDLTNGFRGQREDGWAVQGFLIHTSKEKMS